MIDESKRVECPLCGEVYEVGTAHVKCTERSDKIYFSKYTTPEYTEYFCQVCGAPIKEDTEFFPYCCEECLKISEKEGEEKGEKEIKLVSDNGSKLHKDKFCEVCATPIAEDSEFFPYCSETCKEASKNKRRIAKKPATLSIKGDKAGYECPICGCITSEHVCCDKCTSYSEEIKEPIITSDKGAEYRECVVCGEKLKEGQKFFCSEACAKFGVEDPQPKKTWAETRHKQICNHC